MKEALNQLNGLKVLVVGDLMVDRYQWGDAGRISPEAPVPVVKVRREETRLGGAANVVNNLTALGCAVGVCGFVGDDHSGRELVAALREKGVDVSGVITHPGRPTTTKVRVMAQDHQLLRCDWEDASLASGPPHDKLLDALGNILPDYQGVIVSDYAKGVVTPQVVAMLVKVGAETEKPVVVDPKGSDYARYRGVTCLTPNEHEAAQAVGADAAGANLDDEDAVLRAGKELQRLVESPMICITRGPNGVMGLQADGVYRFMGTRAREVYDVTGAGDTFIALLGALLAAGRPFFQCVEMANVAAGIVVGKLGTATVSAGEMLDYEGGPRKIYAEEEAAALGTILHGQGRRIVFTNGCFDLLHSGHIQYLQASRAEGDLLVVGLNSDESVTRLKGPQRPLIGEEDRAHLLAALAAVDYVVVFSKDTALELIKAIRPHVLTKGADYTVETVVGHDIVPQWGGQVRLIDLKENRSTSGIIEKIVESHKE